MKKLIGLIASVAILGAGPALADDKSRGAGQSQPQSDINKDTGASGVSGSQDQARGGSGVTGTSAGTTAGMGDQERMGKMITGRVVRADRNALFVEHMGAIVELRVDQKTTFDPQLKNLQGVTEGSQVLAQFRVQDQIRNVATRISMGDTGTGASGGMQKGQGGSPHGGQPGGHMGHDKDVGGQR